jgi:hypothetical protein
MTISNQPASLLESVLDAQATRQEVSIAVLKKAQDQVKQQGQQMVQLLEQAGLSTDRPLLDTYA